MGRKELDATSLSRLTFMHWRRKWQPTPVFLPGEPQGRGSLVGCCLWGHTDSDMTEAMQQQGHLYAIFKKYVFQCYMIQGGWTPGVELWTWRADFQVLYRFSAVWGSVPLSLCCSEVNCTVISSSFSCITCHCVMERCDLASFLLFSTVAQSCPTLWDPMDRSTPGLPVHHQLPELTQTHVHWVSDAIQPSHPLSSPSPRAFYLSRH